MYGLFCFTASCSGKVTVPNRPSFLELISEKPFFNKKSPTRFLAVRTSSLCCSTTCWIRSCWPLTAWGCTCSTGTRASSSCKGIPLTKSSSSRSSMHSLAVSWPSSMHMRAYPAYPHDPWRVLQDIQSTFEAENKQENTSCCMTWKSALSPCSHQKEGANYVIHTTASRLNLLSCSSFLASFNCFKHSSADPRSH